MHIRINFDPKKYEPETLELKRFVKQKLEFDEETLRMIQAAAWMREHFPWLVKIIGWFIKD